MSDIDLPSTAIASAGLVVCLALLAAIGYTEWGLLGVVAYPSVVVATVVAVNVVLWGEV